jgi:hypothetical protein
MKKFPYLLIAITWLTLYGCTDSPKVAPVDAEKVIIDSLDTNFGYYMKVEPTTTADGEPPPTKGVLVLLPGFGQPSESVFLDSDLPAIAAQNGFLTVSFAGIMRFTADSVIQEKLTSVIAHVLATNEVDSTNFFVGGFSSGGVIALRYVELCYQYPQQFPVQPRAVFMADSPVDIFHLWKLKEEDLRQNRSEIAVAEANWLAESFCQYYGATPSESKEVFEELSPFSIDTTYGTNEQYLQNVALRAYHDIDVAWRINNRNQTARFGNYIATSELINRLHIMGNDQAEFIQTYQTGYRRNGERHPHSWSIIDAEECVAWMESLMEEN